jgi:hypothetical protein
VTHGTRSAYNRGCRCEACREASRLARARQRDAVRIRRAGRDTEADAIDVASPWGLVVILGGGAVWCLWQARQIPQDDDPVHAAARRRWIVAGLLFAGFALALACLAGGEDADPV